jgi:hypothetical protein
MLDPESVLRLAKERQAHLLREVEVERMLAAQSGRTQAHRRLVRALVLRASDLLVNWGLELRTRAGEQPLPAPTSGPWQPVPLLLLRLARGRVSARVEWWPALALNAPALASYRTYAIVPALWLASPE